MSTAMLQCRQQQCKHSIYERMYLAWEPHGQAQLKQSLPPSSALSFTLTH